MHFPVLPLFPEGSLSESVTTTVWVGVCVLTVLNLRFGWTLSGLVTPGYLVPLMIVKPLAAAVICAEAALSYFCVWVFSQYASRRGWWSNFFGRDRFFALVLASICIKVLFDGYLFPWLGRYLQEQWRLEFDFDNNLHSFGLIVMALLANQFWKPGFLRGLWPVVITVGLTYLLVRGPLMHFTNFSISNLEFMYEDIATSILASPKAYIILIVTAFMASRMNLTYAWDYNGILIPSLLALQWYEPLKILSSFCEAYLIYGVATWILQLSCFKESTIEGARKVLLFFNISFAYKLLVGHLIAGFLPSLEADDCFGFGYMLPSLIAMKMHDKNILLRLSRTTLETSFAGAIFASVIGFGLSMATQACVGSSRAEGEGAGLVIAEERFDLKSLLNEAKLGLYEARVAEGKTRPLVWELEAFARGMEILRFGKWLEDRESLEEAAGWMGRAGFRTRVFAGGHLVIDEAGTRRGWGWYLLGAWQGLIVEVPAPLEEWATLEAGGYLFQLLDGRALAIGTSATGSKGAGAASIFVDHRSCFDVFHRIFSGRNVLQVRGYTHEMAGGLLGGTEVTEDALEAFGNSLWLKGEVPVGLKMKTLKDALKSLRVEWDAPCFKNVARDGTPSGFGELFLSQGERKRLLGRFLVGVDEPARPAAGTTVAEEQKMVSLSQWLLSQRRSIAARGSNMYQPPGIETLLFLDEEVLKPLCRLIAAQGGESEPDAEAQTELATIRASASAMKYQLLLHRDPGGKAFLVLAEDETAVPRKYWGTYVFRLGRSSKIVIEIPHPIHEDNTLEFGILMFDELEAGYLLIAGAHPKANTNGTADVLQPENKRSLFNLANQVVLRESQEVPALVVQIRALGAKPGIDMPDVEALLSFSNANVVENSLSDLGKSLTSFLEQGRLRWTFVESSEGLSAYDVHGSAQAMYLNQTKNKECVALWLSPFVRLGYEQYADNALQASQLATLGIESEERGLGEFLKSSVIDHEEPVGDDLLKWLRRYQTTQDINALYIIQSKWPSYRLLRIIDRYSQKPFLLLYNTKGLLPVVASLTFKPADGLVTDEVAQLDPGEPVEEAIRRHVDSGVPFLRLMSGM